MIINPIYTSHYNNTPSKDPIVACAHPKLNQTIQENRIYIESRRYRSDTVHTLLSGEYIRQLLWHTCLDAPYGDARLA